MPKYLIYKHYHKNTTPHLEIQEDNNDIDAIATKIGKQLVEDSLKFKIELTREINFITVYDIRDSREVNLKLTGFLIKEERNRIDEEEQYDLYLELKKKYEV